MFDTFYRYLAVLTKNQQNAVLFIGGFFAALALPPVYFFPILFVSVPLWLLLLEKAATPRRAFMMGWYFGLGYFIAGLYWVAAALFVDIARYWWILPFAVVGLPILMSFYWGLAALGWYYLSWRAWPKLIAFAAIFTLCEYLRGVVFTGFPWNYPGYAWVAYLPVLQSVALFGILGLSFLTILFASVPYLYLTRQYPHHRQRHAFSAVIVLIALAMVAWGYGRLSHAAITTMAAPQIRIVQPNIAQEHKWSPEQLEAQRDTLWRLSKSQANEANPVLVVWPETAIALVDTMDVRVWQQEIQEELPAGTWLATGVLEADMRSDGNPTFYNRLDVFNSDGDAIARYAKSHLVPFGEYLPFEKFWPVKPPAVTAGSFTAGDGVETQQIGDFPTFSPLICYEVIFPQKVVDPRNRPDFLLNVTNDAWYGRTSGPFQHLAISQTRAVEQGLPLLRAANTGISAVIDAQGRKVATLGLNEKGRLDTPLPHKVQPTLFARLGMASWILLLVIAVGIAFYGQWMHQQRPVSVT
ncbi:MAG TPA: apolipoprotein N-acyltransferase [Alphaproteobacteria bacterium]